MILLTLAFNRRLTVELQVRALRVYDAVETGMGEHRLRLDYTYRELRGSAS